MRSGDRDWQKLSGLHCWQYWSRFALTRHCDYACLFCYISSSFSTSWFLCRCLNAHCCCLTRHSKAPSASRFGFRSPSLDWIEEVQSQKFVCASRPCCLQADKDGIQWLHLAWGHRMVCWTTSISSDEHRQTLISLQKKDNAMDIRPVWGPHGDDDVGQPMGPISCKLATIMFLRPVCILLYPLGTIPLHRVL